VEYGGKKGFGPNKEGHDSVMTRTAVSSRVNGSKGTEAEEPKKKRGEEDARKRRISSVSRWSVNTQFKPYQQEKEGGH